MVEQLVEASYNGDLQRVAALLASGVGVNGVNKIGVSALCAAAAVGCVPIVDLLVGAGADPNIESEESTPLCAGASAHRYDGCPPGGGANVVRLLLAAGADANRANANGTTPLYAGAYDAEITRLLLEAGADPNVDSKGLTEGLPLCRAAAWGRLGVVRVLITHGADVNRREDDGSGLTPLRWASSNGHQEIVKALIEAGADPL